jgi:hypothetical protein
MAGMMSTKNDATFTEIPFYGKLNIFESMIIWWINCKGCTVDM